MKLLTITQKVDKNDPILGFFHNWLTKFSKKFESIIVICLEKGESNLRENVKVLSLGKENGANKLKYLNNFYKYIWQERGNYDAVFVHMNQEYVILGWKLWKLLRKNIYLWRNHKQGNFLTRIAVLVSNKVFATSQDSFTARFKKTVLMPVGIDTKIFKIEDNKDKIKNSILFLGRIAPIKRVDLFLKSLRVLKEKGIEFVADVYGGVLPGDQEYFEELKYKNLAHFHPGVPNLETPKIYSSHSIFVNLTPSGSFDKTILEAASCGSIPVVINQSLVEVDRRMVVESLSPEAVAEKIEFWLEASTLEKKELSEKLSRYVLEKHSLDRLMESLLKNIS